MKRNLILNSIVLFVTSFLLVLVVLAWYVSNSTVRATGIIVKTSGDDYTLKLQRGTYTYDLDNDRSSYNSGWYWEWEDTDAMTFSDIQPGDAFHFRIVMESTASHEFSVDFGAIVSSLIEDTLYGYNSSLLVEYTKSSDTKKQEGKEYYFPTFTLDSVIQGYPIKPFTYYEKKLDENNKEYYELTEDETFATGKSYYKARFTLEEFPDFKKNAYYEKGEASTDVNAIGYKIVGTQYSFLYPLFSDNTVKITDDKTLYSYDSEAKTVSLVDYKIEDVFKVYDIGIKEAGKSDLYHDNFYKNDLLYEYNYTKLTNESTLSNDKIYYVKNLDNAYVKVANPVEANKLTYYERGSKKLDSHNEPITRYNNDFLKEASYTFDTENNVEGITYYYFALEFNDEASIENIYGTLSSNCYLYQKLRIGELKVNKIGEE